MQQQWEIALLEQYDLNMNIWQENCQFGNIELHGCHQVAQVALLGDLASVVVFTVWLSLILVTPLRCAPCMLLHTLRCHCAKEVICLCDFSKHSQVSVHHSLHLPMPRKCNSPLPLFSYFGARFLIRGGVFCIVVSQNHPLAIIAIFKAWHMSEYCSRTQPPCLAIVADILKPYKKLCGSKNRISLLSWTYSIHWPSLRGSMPGPCTPGNVYQYIGNQTSQSWQHQGDRFHRVCRQTNWSMREVSW